MTPLLLIIDGGLTLAAGWAVMGLVPAPLRLLERSLIAVVVGLLFGTTATYALALVAGLHVVTVLAGPAVVTLFAVVIGALVGDPREPWRESVADARQRWAGRPPWVAIAVTAGVSAIVWAVFAHTVYTDSGGLEAGYPTVWADWAQHLTTTSSFAVAANLPPVNPLLSGTALLYPFLPDFHAATLTTLGLDAGLALATPGAVLMVAIGLLIVALAQRLGIGAGAGVIAAAICLLGGGIGFIGVFADACTTSGHTATQCTFQYVVTHPLSAPSIIGGTLHGLPGTILAQPRAYDGLPSDGGVAPLPDQQWYTPLLAWWLPQRTLLFGFSAAVSVILLVLAGLRSEKRAWATFVIAGAVVGILTLVHEQTLIALSLILLGFAVRHRRREWLALVGVAVAVGGIRFAQLLAVQHGSAAFANSYPWLEPGWLANAGFSTDSLRGGGVDMSFPNLVLSVGRAAGQLLTPQWWAFWLANLGFAVPVCIVVVVGVVARRAGGVVGSLAQRITAPFPDPLLELALGGVVILAACNVIVFQSWIWDNTKLLVYWYLGAALLVGALTTHLWRGVWRRAAAVAIPGSMLVTGLLVAIRLGPWTPPSDSMTGPFTIADTSELHLAATVERTTPDSAVFLTFGRPNDPILVVAGRIGVMGYYGWLWSYGVAFGSRYGDVQTMYLGCTNTPRACPVAGLLRRYDVSYVEVDDRLSNDAGAIQPATDLAWWAGQGYPVVARSDHITVYDVRGHP